VHTDLETSRSVYNFVFDLCVKLGADPKDLVPFEKYADAAQSLVRPASAAARALNNGVPNIERADKLVQLLAKQRGLSHPRTRPRRRPGGQAPRRQPQESRGLGGDESRRRNHDDTTARRHLPWGEISPHDMPPSCPLCRRGEPQGPRATSDCAMDIPAGRA